MATPWRARERGRLVRAPVDEIEKRWARYTRLARTLRPRSPSDGGGPRAEPCPSHPAPAHHRGRAPLPGRCSCSVCSPLTARKQAMATRTQEDTTRARPDKEQTVQNQGAHG
ncbi:hypothetical protein PsYK624_021900 [Phanerochaete sordida]|uniref:Uncharacterized protein n=1 Tax=Phanerochaete sordida TaxID=48140 RepID=A0A9P3L8H7_9APHY|nr:hypothetical protein PsYK624_021900 [Phanerochaete sordida]